MPFVMLTIPTLGFANILCRRESNVYGLILFLAFTAHAAQLIHGATAEHSRAAVGDDRGSVPKMTGPLMPPFYHLPLNQQTTPIIYLYHLGAQPLYLDKVSHSETNWMKATRVPWATIPM